MPPRPLAQRPWPCGLHSARFRWGPAGPGRAAVMRAPPALWRRLSCAGSAGARIRRAVPGGATAPDCPRTGWRDRRSPWAVWRFHCDRRIDLFGWPACEARSELGVEERRDVTGVWRRFWPSCPRYRRPDGASRSAQKSHKRRVVQPHGNDPMTPHPRPAERYRAHADQDQILRAAPVQSRVGAGAPARPGHRVAGTTRLPCAASTRAGYHPSAESKPTGGPVTGAEHYREAGRLLQEAESAGLALPG